MSELRLLFRRIEGHASPLEAMRASEAANARAPAGLDQAVAGRRILAVRANLSVLELELGGGVQLRFLVRGGQVRGQLGGAPVAERTDVQPPEATVIGVGDADEERWRQDWARTDVLCSRIGRELTQVYFGDPDVWLYVRDAPDLGLCATTRRPDGAPVLYFYEDIDS